MFREGQANQVAQHQDGGCVGESEGHDIHVCPVILKQNEHRCLCRAEAARGNGQTDDEEDDRDIRNKSNKRDLHVECPDRDIEEGDKEGVVDDAPEQEYAIGSPGGFVEYLKKVQVLDFECQTAGRQPFQDDNEQEIQDGKTNEEDQQITEQCRCWGQDDQTDDGHVDQGFLGDAVEECHQPR